MEVLQWLERKFHGLLGATCPTRFSLPQVHGVRNSAGHGRGTSTLVAQGPTEPTPPFSYCEEVGSARPLGVEGDGSLFRLNQPLVSFSPPFHTTPVDPRGHESIFGQEGGGAGTSSPHCTMNGQNGSEVRRRGQRTSLMALAASGSPALLETLPESPFSWKSRPRGGAQPSAVVDTAAGAGQVPGVSIPPLVQGRLNASLGPVHETSTTEAGIDNSEVRAEWIMLALSLNLTN